VRVGAFIDGDTNYKSYDDRQMLAMMTVVNRFREDTKDATPREQMARLEEEALQAFSRSSS